VKSIGVLRNRPPWAARKQNGCAPAFPFPGDFPSDWPSMATPSIFSAIGRPHGLKVHPWNEDAKTAYPWVATL
jgi:hypothetical protein